MHLTEIYVFLLLTSFTSAQFSTAVSQTNASSTVPANATLTSKVCLKSRCADFLNTCGLVYGGCYPACSGYKKPEFVVPDCPSFVPPTADDPSPTEDPPGDPPATTDPPTTTSSSCDVICQTYADQCGNLYGPGCYTSCPGAVPPHVITPPCTPPPSPTTVQPVILAATVTSSAEDGCIYACEDYFDDCGNAYGPGCYMSCPGQTLPTYTIPLCSPTTA